jgi:tetratricopeptide (TPR) repeat protein
MDLAEDCFLQAIGQNFGHSGAHVNLGNIYQNSGRTALAEEEFRLVLSINPALFAPYINLARLYQSTGKIEPAREIVQLGLQRFPDNVALKQLADEIDSSP